MPSPPQRARGATPAAQPPLAPPMGELASEASLRGRRQWKIWKNTEIAAGYPLSHGTNAQTCSCLRPLSHGFQPCQLSQRESQGAGFARPAHRNVCGGDLAAQPPLAPPMGELSSEARLRGRRQLQIWEKCHDCCMAPSQSRLRRASSPKGRAKGRLRRPAIYHPPSNRVTPNGVRQLPGHQTCHSQRVQPALSVTAFSRTSSPFGRAKGRLRRRLHRDFCPGHSPSLRLPHHALDGLAFLFVGLAWA